MEAGACEKRAFLLPREGTWHGCLDGAAPPDWAMITSMEWNRGEPWVGEAGKAAESGRIEEGTRADRVLR